MTDELLDALAAEVGRQLAALRTEMRRERAAELAEVRRSFELAFAEERERRTEAEHQLELVRAEVAAGREVVVALHRDSDGTLHLVQRHGPPLSVALPDVDAIVRAEVEARLALLRPELEAEVQARIARTADLYFAPPTWSAGAVYMEGQIVATDVGRTYRVRSGVKAAAGREPGDDPAHWERLGTGGFRVFKSKPLALQAGDMFTEHDARFLHDGQTTVLLVPKGPKTSDFERQQRANAGRLDSNDAHDRDQDATLAAHGQAIARAEAAANDASEAGVQALAATEELRTELDAVREVVERLQAGGGGRP